MRLVRASDINNEKLVEYFEQTLLPGPVDLQFKRLFNFFNQYRIQSEDFVTYTLLNDKDEIEAMVSLIFRKGCIAGEEQTIGFATDLRVSRSRKAIVSWAQHFLPALTEERDKRNCKYIFSVVANGQRQAYNAFIRPRSPRRKMPRYYSYRRFQAVSLHGLLPFAPKPLSGIQMRSATDGDFGILTDYILKKRKELQLHYSPSKEAIQRDLERWRDLYIENFILAFDYDDNLIGCTAPWSSAQVQQLVAKRYRPKARSIQESLYLLSFLGITHSVAEQGKALNFRYLTHLFADNPDIFYSLLHYAWKSISKKEFLVYPHFEGNLLTAPPKAFLHSRIKAGLYCILGPNEPIPDFLKPRLFSDAPEFELAFL